MRKIEHILAILILAFVLASANTVEAHSQFSNSFTADQARDARKQGKVLGASECMRIVQRRYPNLKVGDTRLISGGSQGAKYLVKMLSKDGRVIEVVVDARTGHILSTRGN